MKKVLDFLERIKDYQLFCSVIVVCIVLIFCVNLFVSSLSKNSITVTGSFSQNVTSDNGKLDFDILIKAPTKQAAIKELNKQTPIVVKYLEKEGILSPDIELKTINSYETFQMNSNGYPTNNILHYNISQTISIKSDDVLKIKKISTDISSLIDQGINISLYEPQYFYSKLSDLKVKMLEEASKDAKQRAIAMLKSTGNKVGTVQSVKMGVFQITPINSTNVSDMGINDTSSIEKKITSVANVVFSIK